MTPSPQIFDPKAYLITIVREDNDLIALVNTPRRLCPSTEPSSSSQSKTTSPSYIYETTRHPLIMVPRSIYPNARRLLDAWQAISESTFLTEHVFDCLVLLLRHTVPALHSSARAFRPLTIGEKGSSFRATAARPRAYKGTRDRPPKQPQSNPHDLRLYLSSLDGTQRLWEYIRHHIPHYVTRVGGNLATARNQPSGKTDQDLALSLLIPNLQKSERSERWPPLFLQHIVSSPGGSTALERRECLSLFYALNLESEPSLLSGISRIARLGDIAHARLWGRVIRQQPVERRNSFVAHIIEENCCAIFPNESLSQGFEELNHLTNSSNYHLWIRRFLAGWRQGTSLDYLVAGFKIASQFRPGHEFSSIGKCPDFPLKQIEDLACYFPNTDSDLGYRLLRAWERSAQLNNFTGVLRDISWFKFPPETAYRIFELILDVCWYYENSPRYRHIWSVFRSELSSIERVVCGLPLEYQVRALDELYGYICQDGNYSDLRVRLRRSYQLLLKTCCPPHASDVEVSDVAGVFLSLKDPSLWAEFLTAISTSFLELDRVAQRKNEERLVAYGVHAICDVIPAFAVESFRKAPRSLFKVAKTLGCLSYPVRIQLMRELAGHPLFSSELEYLPILDACKRLLDLCGTHIWNPMPHYLKRWACGEYHLSQDRVVRYFQMCFDNLDRARLSLIDHQALAHLCHGLPKVHAKGAVQHAVQLLGSIDHNRRGLRRFLHAYWNGQFSYLAEHPATQAWVKRHPKISVKIWKEGLVLSERIGRMSIELKIEDDPMEVLKMGTYVGSCLGLGGVCADSSAAVLLDMNKQVVYARDQHGKVLGRQLLALSKDDQLVCFSVYPLNTKSQVHALFLKYDRDFAKLLGLPLYKEDKDGRQQSYDIENILSDYWWDDGPWDSPSLKKLNKTGRHPTKLKRASNL